MDDKRRLGRRDALRAGAAAGLGLGLAGCTAPGDGPLFEERFEWAPEEVPETLYLSLGVSVVWESDATHYLDSVTVEER